MVMSVCTCMHACLMVYLAVRACGVGGTHHCQSDGCRGVEFYIVLRCSKSEVTLSLATNSLAVSDTRLAFMSTNDTHCCTRSDCDVVVAGMHGNIVIIRTGQNHRYIRSEGLAYSYVHNL